MIQYQWLAFTELNVEQLYAILRLRAEVFVVEQACPYLDPDGRDQHSLHLLGTEEGELLVYLRLLLPKGEQALSFGRLVAAPKARGRGAARDAMKKMIEYCRQYYPGMQIQCSAQYYLKAFYESFGLVAAGDVYDEDGIDHVAMHLNIAD